MPTFSNDRVHFLAILSLEMAHKFCRPKQTYQELYWQSYLMPRVCTCLLGLCPKERTFKKNSGKKKKKITSNQTSQGLQNIGLKLVIHEIISQIIPLGALHLHLVSPFNIQRLMNKFPLLPNAYYSACKSRLRNQKLKATGKHFMTYHNLCWENGRSLIIQV